MAEIEEEEKERSPNWQEHLNQKFYYYIDDTTKELIVRYNGGEPKKFDISYSRRRMDGEGGIIDILWKEYGVKARYLLDFIRTYRLNSLRFRDPIKSPPHSHIFKKTINSQ